MADMMDKTITSILTAFVAVVLIASAFIPTVIPLIQKVDDTNGYQTLLGVVVTMTIIGVVIGVIKQYMGRSSE